MTNLIIEISKYFMIFMFAFYTYECFAAFRQKIKPEQREHILSRQCAAIFLIHFDAFVVIYLVMSDIIEPWKLGLFREMTIGRRDGFVKMMAMDVIGAGALLYWILGMLGGVVLLLALCTLFL